jgi:hypothetical protein
MDQARALSLGESYHLAVSERDILTIAGNPAMKAEFRRLLDNANDRELHDQIKQFVLDMADRLDDDAQGADRRVDLLDRAGLTIAASITATGIGGIAAGLFAVAATGISLGPFAALLGGLVGLVVTATGRHTLKTRSDESKSSARKLRRLVGRD